MIDRYRKLKAILVTVCLHLVAAILFMSVKLGNLRPADYAMEYEVSLEEIAREQDALLRDISGAKTVEQVLKGDQELLNIARNLANQPDIKISHEEYIDMVKEEMIKNGQLGKDNYIDEWKNREADENVVIINENEKEPEKEQEPSKANDLASKYSGPTRIYYNLPGRVHSYLPVPIYKCEGSGKVSLSITVTPKGAVTDAKVIATESTTSDPCLIETAVMSAMVSRFNADASVTKSQTGTLTYHFVAQ